MPGDAGEVRQCRLAQVRRVGERRARGQLDALAHRSAAAAPGSPARRARLRASNARAVSRRRCARTRSARTISHGWGQQRELRQRARGRVELGAGSRGPARPAAPARAARPPRRPAQLDAGPARAPRPPSRLPRARHDSAPRRPGSTSSQNGVLTMPQRRRAPSPAGIARAARTSLSSRASAAIAAERARGGERRDAARVAVAAAPSPRSSSGRRRRSRRPGCASSRRCRCRSNPRRAVPQPPMPDPPDDPPAQRAGSCGLRAGPHTDARPVVPIPSSCCWATPTTTAPASRSRANTPDAPGGSSSRAVPPCAPRHGVVNMSFRVSGTPRSGPVGRRGEHRARFRGEHDRRRGSAHRRARRSARASRRAARPRRASRLRPPAPARAGRGPGDRSRRARRVERRARARAGAGPPRRVPRSPGRTRRPRSAAARGRPLISCAPSCGGAQRPRRRSKSAMEPTLPSASPCFDIRAAWQAFAVLRLMAQRFLRTRGACARRARSSSCSRSPPATGCTASRPTSCCGPTRTTRAQLNNNLHQAVYAARRALEAAGADATTVLALREDVPEPRRRRSAWTRSSSKLRSRAARADGERAPRTRRRWPALRRRAAARGPLRGLDHRPPRRAARAASSRAYLELAALQELPDDAVEVLQRALALDPLHERRDARR